MCWRRVAAVPILAASLAACAAVDRLGAERMRAVATEQLCTWRGNAISGRQMVRELARRGEDCTGFAAATLAGAPVASTPSRPPVPSDVPTPPSPTGLAPRPEAESEAVATLSAATPTAPAARSRTALPEAGAAPLVTPACAERILRRGDEDGAPSRTRAVAFRNRCGFPIRVLYAASASGRLTSVTGPLQPGESSGFAPVEDGFDQPGYVVCSYAAVPTSQDCRVRSGPG